MVESWPQLYENHVERESSGSLEGQQSAVAEEWSMDAWKVGQTMRLLQTALPKPGVDTFYILCPEVVCVLDDL